MCEPHNSSVVHVGPSGATAVPGETWASLGNLTKKLMVHPGVHCIFEGRRGPKRRGTQGNLPLLPPFPRACLHANYLVAMVTLRLDVGRTIARSWVQLPVGWLLLGWVTICRQVNNLGT